MSETCDLLIVGAGFVGACTALQAIQDNASQKIVLLDAGPAGGATVLRSSAMFLPFGISESVRKMTRYSIDFYQYYTGFSDVIWESPEFYWVAEKSTKSHIHERLLNQVECTDALSANLVAEQFPGIDTQPTVSLYRDTSVRRAKPSTLHAHLLDKALAASRVALYEGVEVTALTRLQDGSICVNTSFRDIVARRVAICVGGAVRAPVFAPFFQTHTVRAKKIVSFFIPFHNELKTPVGLGFLENDIYVMPEPDRKRWILSVTSQEWDVDVMNARQSFTAIERDDAGQLIKDMLGLTPDRIFGASVYADSYNPERCPRILCPEEFDGHLTLVAACSGYGMKVAPALARAVLDASMESVS